MQCNCLRCKSQRERQEVQRRGHRSQTTSISYLNKKKRDDTKMSKAASNSKKEDNSYTKEQLSKLAAGEKLSARRRAEPQLGRPARLSHHQPPRTKRIRRRTLLMRGQRPRGIRRSRSGISTRGVQRNESGPEEEVNEMVEATRRMERTMVVNSAGTNRLVHLILRVQWGGSNTCFKLTG